MKWITWMLLAALLTACGPVVNEPPAQEKEEDNVTDYDFSALTNVEITGVSLQDFNQEIGRAHV